MDKKTRLISALIITFTLLFTTGFATPQPKTLYRVYLKGKSLGLIESKTSFENYIDQKQEQIKKKYKVNKVYTPTDLDIIKEMTYETKTKTNEEIYEEIKDASEFTINGYVVKINGIDTKNNEGKTIKGKQQKIYVLDKQVFKDAVEKTAKSFISSESYDNYANNNQKEIVETGTIIENIYIKNKITILI